MVDGIGNGPKNPQNVQNRAANIGKAAVKGGLLGAAAGMIGDLLSGKKDSIQSDTLNVKGLSLERQSQADYSSGGISGTIDYVASGTIDYNGTSDYSYSGTVEYQGSVDYQGTVYYRGSQE